MVAGYAWAWVTKGKSYEEALSEGMFDIIIDNEKLIRNTTNSSWVISNNAINEVGRIHTIQGYDLNYVGVIIGPDITYNLKSKRIEIVKANYNDSKGKSGIHNDEELMKYIINIYKVLLTRGIKGTYLYVCNQALKEHLSKFITYHRQ